MLIKPTRQEKKEVEKREKFLALNGKIKPIRKSCTTRVMSNNSVPYSRMSTIQRIGNTSDLYEKRLLTELCGERTG